MPVSKIFANLNVKGGTEQKTTPTFFTRFAKKKSHASKHSLQGDSVKLTNS